MGKSKNGERGNATLEYIILLPIVFVCIFLCVFIFLILYQKTLIQNIAEDAAQSISRQWGYNPLPVGEISTGVYRKETYENREIYWHLKLLSNNKKEAAAKSYMEENSRNLGLLKRYKDHTGQACEPEILVDLKPGIRSVLHVTVKAKYDMPAKGLLRLAGLKEYLLIEARAQAMVYDPKELINTTDYVYQLITESKFYEKFAEKIKLLKENLDKFLKE